MARELDFKFALSLPPAEAIAFLKVKGYKITWSWREQLKLNNAQVFTVAKAMQMSVLQDIRDMLKKANLQGFGFKDFKKELEPRLKAAGWWGWHVIDGKRVQLGSVNRLKTIFDTNMQTGFNVGRWKHFEENKEARPMLEYVAVIDDATRPEHEALDGEIHPVGDPFWNTYAPPNGYNSFVPDTEMRGTFTGGSRRSYSGKVVTIKTEKNRTLTVTPNHPVPTMRGFVAAGNLRKTDKIFCYAGSAEPMIGAFPSLTAENINYVPIPIKKIFDLLCIMKPLRSAHIGPNDFYGDLSIGDSNINIVNLNSKLTDRVKSYVVYNFEDLLFKSSCPCDCTHLSLGIPDFFFERFFSTPGSSPGPTTLADNGRVILLDLSPFKKFSFSPAPSGYSIFPEDSYNSGSAYSKFFGKLQNGFSPVIQIDEISDIFKDNFSGHVYDLQSPSGLIIANDVIISNCRCRLKSLSTVEAARVGGESKGVPKFEDPKTKQEKTARPDEGFDQNAANKRFAPEKKNYDNDIFNAVEKGSK